MREGIETLGLQRIVKRYSIGQMEEEATTNWNGTGNTERQRTK